MSEQHAHTHDHDHEHGDGCGIEQFHIRELRVRKDIMGKATELADLIMSSDEVQTYRSAEGKISGHKDIQALISTIKKKQKEIVAFETTFKNGEMVKKIEKEIDELQDRLDGYPIVTEFRQSQSDLNYLLQLIIDIVRDSVSKKIEVEAASATVSSGGCE